MSDTLTPNAPSSAATSIDTPSAATTATTATTAKADAPRTTRRVTFTPPVDIVEDGKGITLWADLPGVSRERLDVKVHDGRLFIEAEASVPTRGDARVHHAEIRVPHFARAFTLSDDLDTEHVDAQLHDGVLKLTIARREIARPRKIDVRAV